MNSHLQKINDDVRSFVERANVGQRGLRVVPLGVAFEVARRSLVTTEGETFSVRRFRALSAVSDFVSLSQKNKLTTLSVENADLLPVAHPASLRKHRMSQFDVLRAQARWYADDARVKDSGVSSLLSTLFTESADTPEYEYSYARLRAMTAGGVPVSALIAVALGFNDGANKGYWRQQIRDRKGRFAEMGGGVSINVGRNGQVFKQTGQVVSTDVRNGRVRLRTPDNRIIEVDTDALNIDEDVKAILPSEATPDGVSAEPIRVGSDEKVIPEGDLTLVDSPNGFNRSDDAVRPSGMEGVDGVEVWGDELGNYQVAKGGFREGEGDEFVVSRLEEGKVVPLRAGKNWNDVQAIIGEDEPKFEDGDDAETDLPRGLNFSENDVDSTPMDSGELRPSVSGDEIQAIKEQSLNDFASEQGRFPLGRQAQSDSWGEKTDVAQAAKRDYGKVYDLLKERDSGFAEKYPDMDSFWDQVKQYGLDERTRAANSVDEIPEEVKQFNRGYAEAVLGMDPDGELTLYRNAINNPANIKQAGTGYWTTDRDFARDYGATPDNIRSSQEEGSFNGFYEARVRPDQVGGMLGYSQMEDEFSLSIGPDVAEEEGRIARLGPIDPPELPEWLDPENKLDAEKRTGGSAFRHQALAGALNLKKVDNNPMGDAKLNEFLEANGLSREDWASRYDELWGEGSYAEAKAAGNNPSFEQLQRSFKQDDDGKWFLDVENFEFQGQGLNASRYGDENPDNWKNDKFDSKMKMLGLVQDITGDEFMSVRMPEPREMPDRGDRGPATDIEEPTSPDSAEDLIEGGDIEGYRVDRSPYEPKGPSADVESEEYTDDPADLAARFTPEELGDALKDAVDDGTGLGRLEFEDDKGTEDVPAEALYNALRAQGVDADDFLDRVEAGEDVKAQLPEGAEIPGFDDGPSGRFEDARSLRELLGDNLPAVLQGLTDRELQALIDSDFDFRDLVPDNNEFDVPEGFYELNESDYDSLAPIPGAPGGLKPFDLALEFSGEQLEGQLREALVPGGERPGYGKFDLPDSDGESQAFDVPAEAIVDALKLQGIDTNQLLNEVYGGSDMTPSEVDDAIAGEDIATPDVFGGLDEDKKRELIESTKEGGYTVDFVSGDVPEDGYMVASEADVPDGDGGLKKREEVVTRADFDEDPEKYLDEFVARNLDRLTQDGYYIGTWTQTVEDKDTGERTEYVYFDVSERLEDKEEALQAARERDEEAIFGLAEFEEFFTDPEKEAQKNARKEAEEGDGSGSEELPGDDGAGTPGVDEADGSGDSGESEEQQEVVDEQDPSELSPDEVAAGYGWFKNADGSYERPGPNDNAWDVRQLRNGQWLLTERIADGDEREAGTFDSAAEAFEQGQINTEGPEFDFGQVLDFRESEGSSEEREEVVPGGDVSSLGPDELAAGYGWFRNSDGSYEGTNFRDGGVFDIAQLPNGRWILTERLNDREIGEFDSAAEAFEQGQVVVEGPDFDYGQVLDSFRDPAEREKFIYRSSGSRPFGEEIVELDTTGDVESQINDAVENQRELEFAYPGSEGGIVARLIRPLRVEENERTGNVNVLGVDDEGNFKKFTLSKIRPVSDADDLRDEVSTERSPGDEVDTDDASLSSDARDNFVAAESEVVDEIYESDDVNDTNDVEDLGEQEDTADNVTSEIVNRVDESAAGGDEGPEQRVVDDVVEGALVDGDDAVPSLDDLINDARDEDNFDPDIIWQKVQDDYEGKVLENGHIVVSSTVHSTRRGDRRYDVVVRRASDNTFHIYHRVTYPDGSTKVKEMGGQGWHSSKALFSRINDQIDNSVNSPNSTINKALKPENDRTLFADNPAPSQPESFVAADGTVLQKDDRVTVVNPNHSKAGMGGRVVRAERRFNSKDFTYTDYVKVKYDDGTKNWIVSKSVQKEAGSAPNVDVDAESALNERQSGGVPDNLLAGSNFDSNVENLFNVSDSSSLNNVVDGLEGALGFLPTPDNTAAGDSNLPDAEVQRVARNIKQRLPGLRQSIDSALSRLNDTESFDGDTPGSLSARLEFANTVDNLGSALVSSGSNLENAAKDVGGPREEFYRDLGRRLINAGDALQGAAEDARVGLRDAYDSAGAETVATGLPDSNDLTIDSIKVFVGDIASRLPEPSPPLPLGASSSNDLPPFEHRVAAHNLRVKFQNSLDAADGDVSRLDASALDEAISNFVATEGRHEGVRQDLEKLKEAINLYKARQPAVPYAAPGLEAFDPLEVRDSRIASGENVFVPDEDNNIRSFVLSDARDGQSPLNAFEDELDGFFDGSPKALAELSPRARIALQIFAGQNLKNNGAISPEVEQSMIELVRGLEVEEQAYYPQRESLGKEVDVLKDLPDWHFDGLAPGEEVGMNDGVLDENQVKTGWIVQRRGSGNSSTYQLKHETTGEVIWVKNETTLVGETDDVARTFAAEYVANEISRLMGASGVPVVEFSRENRTVMFMSQAGDTEPLEGNVSEYSDNYPENGPQFDGVKDIALMDVVRLNILDFAMMQTDRHGSNFLTGVLNQRGVSNPDSFDSRRLIPIDNGFSGAFVEYLTDMDERTYLEQGGATGGDLGRELIRTMGSERFQNIAFPIVENLISDLRNLRDAEPPEFGAYSGMSKFMWEDALTEGIDNVITNLMAYLQSSTVFDDIDRRAQIARGAQ